MKKKVLMLGNSALVIFGMRGELIQRLVREGYDVTVAFPNGKFGEGDGISKEYGCTFKAVQINRRGTNPLQDIGLVVSYIKLMKELKPDIVLTYTVKCSLYGGLVCRMLRIPYLVNITGLGKGLAEAGVRKKLITMLYRLAVKDALCVFFQNRSDRQFFIDNKIKYKKDELLPGSGVNLQKYTTQPYPCDDRIIFIFIARVMKTKGIDQFLDAASEIHKQNGNVQFHVCGAFEDDYQEIIENAQKKGEIVYHGMVSDIRAYEEMSHCVVLPTYHPEGVSNVLLEAAACARPIITTNRHGCREVVDDGVNGFFVKERDSQDLIRVIQKFMSLTWEERRDMGLAGRAKVEREFDRQIVVEKYMELIEDCIG